MAAPTPMSDFNKSSAKIAQVIAKICHGRKSSYKYMEKKSGKEVTAYKFECFLLGEQEGVYMYGFLKGTQQQVNDAANKFKDGRVFKLSKISLDTWTSTSSISSPKAFRLNLEKTTCQQIAADDALAQQIALAPVPPRTVGETAMVTTNKAQDLLAVVKAATNKRTTREGIDIIDAVLIDDSKAETGKLATVLVSVWGDQKVYLIEKNVGNRWRFQPDDHNGRGQKSCQPLRRGTFVGRTRLREDDALASTGVDAHRCDEHCAVVVGEGVASTRISRRVWSAASLLCSLPRFDCRGARSSKHAECRAHPLVAD